MNVLMITTDVNVLRDGTLAQADVKRWATGANRFVVIVLNSHRNRYPALRISDSLWILPTNSYVPIFKPVRAILLARRELYFQGRLQTDVVCAQDPLSAGFTAWLIKRIFRRPLQIHIGLNVLSSSYGDQSFFHLLRRILAEFLVQRADALHTNSESVRAALADISTSLSDRATVAPRYMDVGAIQKEPVRVDLRAKYPQFKFIMLVTAPLIKTQNVQLAITILAGVVRVYPHVGLVVVGEGPLLHKLKSYAARVGVSERIAFENWNDNLSSYYNTAQVFLVTAPYEEYGNVIAKAAACGCAVVSSNIGTAEAALINEESGFLCDPADPARYVATVILMIRKPEVRNSVRLNAMLAIQKFMNANPEEDVRLYKESWEHAITEAAGAPYQRSPSRA